MNQAVASKLLSEADAFGKWQQEYAAGVGVDKTVVNRSGIPIQPLYTDRDWNTAQHAADLGLPGQAPYTRGIYATMHRGKTWSQRQLTGLGTPAEYNARLLDVLANGATAVSLLPCNSVFRGYDMDESHIELLGTCGTVINTSAHMDRALQGVDLAQVSCAQNDPTPFTLLAFMLATARRRGTDWRLLSGTSNQSDYLSHYAANHMFFRLALPGARRLLADHIEFCNRFLPKWNPMSVVGQHTQQAGATPAEAMAFTLSTAIQNARDCLARGMDPDQFLPRFTFFFDVSISFFEEIAKFRAARRIWARITRDQLGAKDPRSWRFKFHAQTSGVDLTRQQPLNNIARVTTQAMAGILGGLQSLHTDAYDEALSCPSEFGARIAIATQNVLREEAHLTDVIDPLGGSYYVETLTDQMQAEIERVMAIVEDAGGMYQAVQMGLVQGMIGESARKFQQRIDAGEQTVVGVNAYCVDEDASARPINTRPDRASMQALIDEFKVFKAERSQAEVQAALDALARSANDAKVNVFGRVVEAAQACCTHGEICHTLRREMGFGDVQAVV
ncbi:MAG: acyl-CoA mutase large subunit family protein [Rhodoferax sp.]|uniref:acyl-CoA mutase large subunit family protein n=1 Tax=Rhodoferax sp. TaxID=50421 RepID=UPI002632154C|nr:acyl-CoA mutase large subunit family protein [Rhodoferax sp.]MDD5333348.1 acyl-CoA mutase large subunit family protein [Rhodoferax sp.]